jgi:hypothetical protein
MGMLCPLKKGHATPLVMQDEHGLCVCNGVHPANGRRNMARLNEKVREPGQIWTSQIAQAYMVNLSQGSDKPSWEFHMDLNTFTYTWVAAEALIDEFHMRPWTDPDHQRHFGLDALQR